MTKGDRIKATGAAALASRSTFHWGDPVSWHYRSAIGYGYVQSVARQGKTPTQTLYAVRQVDNHVSATPSVDVPRAAVNQESVAAQFRSAAVMR